MNRRSSKSVVGWATVAGLMVVPSTIVVVQGLLGQVLWTEVVAGSLVGTLFFASTGYLAVHFEGARDLKTFLLAAYATKISLLVSGAMLLPTESLDKDAFAVATVLSAAAYVSTSVVLFARGNPGRGRTPVRP